MSHSEDSEGPQKKQKKGIMIKWIGGFCKRWRQPHLMLVSIGQCSAKICLTLPSLSLSAAEELAGWGSRDRVESSVGGGVGLLERVIFFFLQGERRMVMCAELMTKGPFMCSVCR